MIVVLDTNNLPRNVAAPSAAFRRITKLIEEGVIRVEMPFVIAEEWRTQQAEHLRRQLQKSEEALKDILEGGHLEGNAEVPPLAASIDAIRRTAPHVDALSRQALERLIRQLRTEVIPIAGIHGSRVIEAYFKGAAPFSGVKARKDFPDAFIYEAVSDLARVDPPEQFVVVTADGNLSKSLSALRNVTCVASLEQLVESDQVSRLTADIALETRWRAELQEVVATVRQRLQLLLATVDFQNSFVNSVAEHRVYHPSIPSDDGEAGISQVDDPEDMEIEWDAVEDYGPGLFRVPFSCRSEVLLGFPVHYSEAYGQPEFVMIQWGDHEETPSFEAEAYAFACVRGFLSIALNEWPNNAAPQNVVASVDEIAEIKLDEDEYGNALH
jgi:hypothetical protein